MNKTVRMVTAVPQDLAQQLVKNKRITNYNTLPQLNADVLEGIRSYLGEYVGYENAPIACLSKVHKQEADLKAAGTTLPQYIPVNARNSIIFELSMPEDCIVSIEYKKLLDYSSQMNNAVDQFEKDMILEDLHADLQVGLAGELEDAISFIPFIELEKCQFFAILNSAFETNRINIPGLEQVDLRELSSFYC